MEEATGATGASAHQVNRGEASTFGGGQDERRRVTESCPMRGPRAEPLRSRGWLTEMKREALLAQQTLRLRQVRPGPLHFQQGSHIQDRFAGQEDAGWKWLSHLPSTPTRWSISPLEAVTLSPQCLVLLLILRLQKWIKNKWATEEEEMTTTTKASKTNGEKRLKWRTSQKVKLARIGNWLDIKAE